MGEFIREAGWGILPVLLFGGIAALVAVVFTATLRREALPLLGFFWVTTLLSGTLGTVIGLRGTLRKGLTIPPERLLTIIADGALESSNNIVAALVIGIGVALVAGIGGFRLLWRSAGRS
jgi:hypothetical protein